MESIPENKKYKLLWDYEIQGDPMILARRPDLVIFNKRERERERESQIVVFVVLADHRVKLIEGKRGINIWTLLES